jgi:hypothetical protein
MPRCSLREHSGRFAALCFEICAFGQTRATFPKLDRSFSGPEEPRSDNDLRIYRPRFDRPNTHCRFTDLALQSCMGIRASRGHRRRLPDAAGYDVDRSRPWDWGFLAISQAKVPQGREIAVCVAHGVRPRLGML